jgi:hypothetical protein
MEAVIWCAPSRRLETDFREKGVEPATTCQLQAVSSRRAEYRVAHFPNQGVAGSSPAGVANNFN